jgi:threonyl-tRNA synthetase
MISDLDEGTISFYEQGEFTDLCRGPHVPHTGYVKNLKLTKISGAYWRADPSKPQLQRIYGTAFFSKKELKDHLTFLEEAKKRNHRKIGQALDLFSFHEAAPGMPFFHPRGMEIWNALLEYWRVEHREAGYVETKTPIMLNRDLWERSGHWDNYRENMYTSAIDDIEYAIKPMNCPGGVLIYGRKPHSYRDLPLRAAEIGLVHRHELSGVLNGLFRVRAFHQDDAHLYMTPDQIHQEILGILKLSDRMYSAFGLGFDLELSTRPEKSIGTEAQWETATNGLESALKSYGKNYALNEGDGAFYGPNLNYIDKDNQKHRPIMIHRTIFGSIERFLGILIEHFAGKFPLWMTPVQAIVLPINDDLVPYAGEVKDKLRNAGLRVEIDSRTESLNKKVREAQLNYFPLILTIGGKEMEAGTLAVRTLDGKVKYGVSHEMFLNTVLDHIHRRDLSLNIFPD